MELPKKNIKTCLCGNTFVQYSTLDKICPKCKIKAATVKKQAKRDKLPYQVQKFSIGQQTKPKRQKSEKQKAKQRAWLWFSRFIRLCHSVNGQYVVCYTCGKVHGIKEVDAGHFITRSRESVLFNENNCRPQCKKCNRFQQGRSYDFEVKLIDEIGREQVWKLKELAKITVHYDVEDYEQIAEVYKCKVNNLKKEIGMKIW